MAEGGRALHQAACWAVIGHGLRSAALTEFVDHVFGQWPMAPELLADQSDFGQMFEEFHAQVGLFEAPTHTQCAVIGQNHDIGIGECAGDSTGKLWVIGEHERDGGDGLSKTDDGLGEEGVTDINSGDGETGDSGWVCVDNASDIGAGSVGRSVQFEFAESASCSLNDVVFVIDDDEPFGLYVAFADGGWGCQQTLIGQFDGEISVVVGDPAILPDAVTGLENVDSKLFFVVHVKKIRDRTAESLRGAGSSQCVEGGGANA